MWYIVKHRAPLLKHHETLLKYCETSRNTRTLAIRCDNIGARWEDIGARRGNIAARAEFHAISERMKYFMRSLQYSLLKDKYFRKYSRIRYFCSKSLNTRSEWKNIKECNKYPRAILYIRGCGGQLMMNPYGDCWFLISSFWSFQLLLIVIEDIVTSIKKNQITMKIEPVTHIWMFVYAINFELPEMAKKKLWTFRAQPATVRVISSVFCI